MNVPTLLDSADPELLNLVQIENMNGLATNLRSHADVYGSTANVEALEGVDNSLNELFNYIRFLPVAPPNRVTSSAEESVRSFSRSAINVLDGIMRRNEMLGDTIAAQDQKIVEQQSKIDEAGRVIESQKSRLDQAISNNQYVFSQGEAERSKQFIEQSSKWEKDRLETNTTEAKKREDLEWGLREKDSAFMKALEERAQSVMQEMKRLESDTKRIFGVVGNTTQSGEYRNAADDDAKAANKLRLLAFILMCIMATVATVSFVYSLFHPEIDWKSFGFRLGTTLILAIPAVYAAQESAKHRQREATNRRIHLELAAIDAYLELLPEAKKHEIKAALTDKFFGREEKLVPDNNKETSHVLLKIIEEAMKNLTKPQK